MALSLTFHIYRPDERPGLRLHRWANIGGWHWMLCFPWFGKVWLQRTWPIDPIHLEGFGEDKA